MSTTAVKRPAPPFRKRARMGRGRCAKYKQLVLTTSWRRRAAAEVRRVINTRRKGGHILILGAMMWWYAANAPAATSMCVDLSRHASQLTAWSGYQGDTAFPRKKLGQCASRWEERWRRACSRWDVLELRLSCYLRHWRSRHYLRPILLASGLLRQLMHYRPGDHDRGPTPRKNISLLSVNEDDHRWREQVHPSSETISARLMIYGSSPDGHLVDVACGWPTSGAACVAVKHGDEGSHMSAIPNGRVRTRSERGG